DLLSFIDRAGIVIAVDDEVWDALRGAGQRDWSDASVALESECVDHACREAEIDGVVGGEGRYRVGVDAASRAQRRADSGDRDRGDRGDPALAPSEHAPARERGVGGEI